VTILISLLLAKQIVELFLMLIMGVVLVRTHLLKSTSSESLSVVALYLVTPCVIIESFQVKLTSETRDGLMLAFVAAILIHIVLMVVSKVFEKPLHLNKIEKVSIIYSNAGNLIIPIVTAVMGKEWIIYSSAYISIQLIALWTHGRITISGDNHINIKKILVNINMIAIFVGVILFFTGLKLPQIINETFTSVGDMIGPICMIVAGMLIGDMNLKKILSYKRIYLITFLRMIAYPLIILAVLKFSGASTLITNGKTILLISFLATVTPSSATVTQMAQIYGEDAEYASVINVVTTIVCIVTMPIMVALYML
jgi:Predicted permeases